MDNKQLIRLIDELGLEQQIELKDIPNIDLYMDQLITLFEGKLKHTKRYEDDKLLTKTMINNYTKDKLLMPAVKKKYTKQHIILMILLYELKQILSIGDIKEIFLRLTDEKIDDKKLDLIYESYLKCKHLEKQYFDIGIEKRFEAIEQETKGIEIDDEKDLQTLLLIVSLITQASYHKRLAEKLIDGLVEDKAGQHTKENKKTKDS